MVEYVNPLIPFFDVPQIVIIFFTILISSIILGMLIFKLFKVDLYLSSNLLLNIPIYGVAGFILITIVLYIIGIFTVGIASLTALLIILIVAIVVLLYTGDFSLALIKIKRLRWSSRSFIFNSLIPLILITLTFYHFAQVIEIMRWPNIGDIAITHGPLTSLILFLGKIPTSTIEPLANIQLFYPIGFHAFAANIAYLFQIYPAQAVFLIGGLVVSLIPLLMYSMTYMITRSIPLSMIVYFSTFICDQGLMGWINGFFYNGPYPNLVGWMIVIFSIIMLILSEYVPSSKPKKPLNFVLILIFSFFGLLMVYPSFTIWVLLIIVSLLIKHRNELMNLFRKNYLLILSLTPLWVALGISLMSVSVVALQPYFLSFSQTTTYFQGAYAINSSFFIGNVNSYAMWPALLVSVVLLFKRKYSLVNLIYILTFCIPLFTLSGQAPPIIYLILPNRVILIPWVMSWFIISLAFIEFFKTGKLKFLNFPFRNSKFISYTLMFLIILPFFIPSVVQEFSCINTRWGWYTYQSYFQNDFAALCWINNNIPAEDLILNDMSWSGIWILSLSVKNVTFSFHMDKSQWDRANELQQIWEKPYDENMVYQLLKKYNVMYVFVTSEWSYYHWEELSGGDNVYKLKPFWPGVYVNIFDTYSFLEIVFQSGSSTIYRVI